MEAAGIIALVSVVSNVLLGWVGLWQRARKRKALEHLVTVSEGLRVVESAVEENKGVIEKTDIGRKITSSIKKHGPVAKKAVEEARILLREWQASKE